MFPLSQSHASFLGGLAPFLHCCCQLGSNNGLCCCAGNQGSKGCMAEFQHSKLDDPQDALDLRHCLLIARWPSAHWATLLASYLTGPLDPYWVPFLVATPGASLHHSNGGNLRAFLTSWERTGRPKTCRYWELSSMYYGSESNSEPWVLSLRRTCDKPSRPKSNNITKR